MKLFLDDERQPKECLNYMKPRIGNLVELYNQDWAVVKSYTEFVSFVQKNFKEITHISFDHDLADIKYNSGSYLETTGEDCAKWLKEFYKKQKISLPIMFAHSGNPVGTANIINVFK